MSIRTPFLSSCLTGARGLHSFGLYIHRRMTFLVLSDGQNDLTPEEIFSFSPFSKRCITPTLVSNRPLSLLFILKTLLRSWNPAGCNHIPLQLAPPSDALGLFESMMGVLVTSDSHLTNAPSDPPGGVTRWQPVLGFFLPMKG